MQNTRQRVGVVRRELQVKRIAGVERMACTGDIGDIAVCLASKYGKAR